MTSNNIGGEGYISQQWARETGATHGRSPISRAVCRSRMVQDDFDPESTAQAIARKRDRYEQIAMKTA